MSVAVLLLTFWVPGLAVGAAIRLRGWTLAAAAPALTFGVVAVGVIVLGRLGIRWNPLSFGLWVAAVAVLCLAGSLLLARRSGEPTGEPGESAAAPAGAADSVRLTVRQHLMIGLGVAAGIAVGLVTFLRGIGGLNTINQDWDAPFHGNAVRWIAENGDPLPSALGTIANLPGKADYFYPDTYHALLALMLDRAGLSMPHLLNLAAMVVVIAFPLGIAAAGVAWRMPPVAVAVAAAVCTWFTTFPYDSLWRGPLWPFVAGVALLPAALAVARLVVVPQARRSLAGPVGLTLAVAGLAGLHTSLAFVLAGYLLVLMVALLLRTEQVNWRAARGSIIATAALGLLLCVPVVAPALSGSGITAARWPELATPAEAFGQVLLVSPVVPFPQWWLGLPALAGFVLMVVHRRMLWVAGSYLAFGAVYAACASLDNPLVNKLTGPFYNDSWRLAALLSLGGAFAVGYFAHVAGQRLTTRLAGPGLAGLSRWLRQRPSWSAAVAPVAAGLLVVVLAALSAGAYSGRNETRLAIQHRDGPTVSSGERAAYDWIAQRQPRATVMNDRSDGSVWMYALTGLRPVEWTFYGNYEDTDPGLLTARLNQLGQDPRVEQVLGELQVRYVVIGAGFVRETGTRAPGLRDLWNVPGLRRVYTNDDATVYEVSASSRPGTDAQGG